MRGHIMKKVYPSFAALAIAGFALAGCSQSPTHVEPGSPAETVAPGVTPGEPSPAEDSPFSATDADHQAVQAAWSQLTDACDRMDIARLSGGAGDQLVCDPRGAFEVVSADLGEIAFHAEWDADGYVYWTSGEYPVRGETDLSDGQAEDLKLAGYLHPQSGSVMLLPVTQ